MTSLLFIMAPYYKVLPEIPQNIFLKCLKKRAFPGKRGSLVTLRTGNPFDSYL